MISAHKNDLGVIILTHMSNPESEELMVNSMVNGEPYYMQIARKIAEAKGDGCVVGLTNYVRTEYIRNIQEIVGDSAVFLLQGIGPQGGKIQKIKNITNPLISLGREVIYSRNPREKVRSYLDLFK